MARGQESPRVDTKMERIDAMVRGLKVDSQSRQDVHDQMLAELKWRSATATRALPKMPPASTA